jgi:hypothetical protein
VCGSAARTDLYGGRSAMTVPTVTILLIFKDQSTGERCAIHIENKPPRGQWEPHQPETFRKRPANRMSNWRYEDF